MARQVFRNIQFKRGTSAQWSSINPVLDEGEPGYDKDEKKIKIGDGITAWNDLEWAIGDGGSGGSGDGDDFFLRYPVEVASATWTIVHNWGVNPGGITVLDTLGRVVEGDIAYPNNNTVVLTFSSPLSGEAFIS